MTENKDKRAVQELTGQVVTLKRELEAKSRRITELEHDVLVITADRNSWKGLYLKAFAMIEKHTNSLTAWRGGLKLSGNKMGSTPVNGGGE